MEWGVVGWDEGSYAYHCWVKVFYQLQVFNVAFDSASRSTNHKATACLVAQGIEVFQAAQAVFVGHSSGVERAIEGRISGFVT